MRRLSRPLQLAHLFGSHPVVMRLCSSSNPSKPTEEGESNPVTNSWADEAFDGMDLSGITVIRSSPAERERREKTKLFIEALFRVPEEQEVRDMLWAAVANHKTLKPHHLAAMVNEARNLKYAWLGLREATSSTDGTSNTFCDDDEVETLKSKLLRRRERGETSLAASRGTSIPLAYPPSRCFVCFDTLLEAGFVRLVEEQMMQVGVSTSDGHELKANELEGGADCEAPQGPANLLVEAKIVCAKQVEGLVKLLLEDVLRERLSDGTEAEEKGGQKHNTNTAKDPTQLNSKSSRGAQTYPGTNSRTIEDAGLAWQLVSTMGRHGLLLSSPKVLDALEMMIAAGMADRLRYLDESNDLPDCQEMKKHKKVSYQLAVANRADFLEEQRERLRRSNNNSGTSRKTNHSERSAEREPSDHRV